MGFLIRMAFWFSLVLLVLPLDPSSPDGEGPSVSPIQAFFAAREAVGDVSAICDRKPGVCETGKAAFHTIGVRAREGARMAMDMLDETKDGTDAAATGSIARGEISAKPALKAK